MGRGAVHRGSASDVDSRIDAPPSVGAGYLAASKFTPISAWLSEAIVIPTGRGEPKKRKKNVTVRYPCLSREGRDRKAPRAASGTTAKLLTWFT